MTMTVPSASSPLDQWLHYLEHLHHQTIDMGLTRFDTVAQRLDLNSWPAIKIVVGGTNGKGSTCAMLEAILLAAGYTVGTYSSPHLVRYNERIRINGAEASDALICQQFAYIEAQRGQTSLSYFEF